MPLLARPVACSRFVLNRPRLQDGDGCSAACAVEDGYRCEADKNSPPPEGAPWPDVCEPKNASKGSKGAAGSKTGIKGPAEPDSKGGFFSGLFGGKKTAGKAGEL
jgi:hypothetical protein